MGIDNREKGSSDGDAVTSLQRGGGIPPAECDRDFRVDLKYIINIEIRADIADIWYI